MLVAAALVPETALLVPGASGATEVLDDVRAAALAATVELVHARPDRLVVVTACGAPGDLVRTGPLRPTLRAAGIDDATLGWGPAGTEPPATWVQEVPAAVGLLLAHAAGWTGDLHLVTVGSHDAADVRALGRRLVEGPARVALLLTGSLSARRGPDGPLPDDPRAPAFDESVLADLAELGPQAVDRLAAVPRSLATELAVSAWAPWQVLLGAGPESRGAVRWTGAPFGATYVVVSWPGTSRSPGHPGEERPARTAPDPR